MATTARSGQADRAVGSRAGAVAVALWWAGFFFGIIDLSVGLIPSEYPDFSQFVVVETSWGLLYTVFVPVPLIAWAVRPAGWVGPQVVAVAAGVLVAGVAVAAWGQMFVALLVAGSAAFPRMWRPRPRWSMRRLGATPAFWPVDMLVVLGLGAALVHAWDVLDTARRGVGDDDTWGLMHLPMQAGFSLAIPVAAAVGALAMAHRVTSWWFAIVPPAVSAVWFGVVCASHPDLLGSLGRAAGWFAVAWGIAIAVAVWATGYRTRPAEAARASGDRPFGSS